MMAVLFRLLFFINIETKIIINWHSNDSLTRLTLNLEKQKQKVVIIKSSVEVWMSGPTKINSIK